MFSLGNADFLRYLDTVLYLYLMCDIRLLLRREYHEYPMYRHCQ